MNTKNVMALSLFVIAVLVNLFGCYFSVTLMQTVSKPVLMPLLLLNALLLLERTLAPKWLGWLLSFALCFHCAGDILLMPVGRFGFFVAGLFSFLIGHVFYILIFVKKGVMTGVPAFLLALCIACVLGIVLLITGFMDMEGAIKYAVIVYGSALMFVSMLGLSGAVNSRFPDRSPWYLFAFVGGIVFIFSDFLVAWRSILGHSFPHMGFVIMLTYISAECMIVFSIIRSYLPRND